MTSPRERMWIDGETNVLLDADVLFRSRVLHLFVATAASGAFRVRWTSLIVEEARRNLESKRRVHSLRSLDSTLAIVRDPLVDDFEPLVDMFINTDEKDRHVAAAAATCRARFLVTTNVSDFDVIEAATHGFEVVLPDDFGLLLMDANEAAVVNAIQRTPPDRFWDYLVGLKNAKDGLPKTYERLAVIYRSAGFQIP